MYVVDALEDRLRERGDYVVRGAPGTEQEYPGQRAAGCLAADEHRRHELEERHQALLGIGEPLRRCEEVVYGSLKGPGLHVVRIDHSGSLGRRQAA